MQCCSPPDCAVSSLWAGDHGSSVGVSHAVQRRRRMAAQAVSFRRAGLFRGRMPDVAPQATFTSLRAEHWTRLGDVTPEDAYTLHLNRRSSTSISLYGRFGGRQRHDIPFRGATLFDLSDLPMVEVEGRYDMMRVYLPRQRMISVAESMARRSDVRLRLPKPGFDDYIITNLLNIINFAFENPEQTSQLLVDEVSILLMSHLIHNYSDVSPDRAQPRRARVMAGAHRQGNSVRPNLQPSDRRRTRPGLRRVGPTFHPGFPAVHRTHAAPMADAGAGPQRQEPPRAFRQDACRDFSDVRLRQSKPLLPRFPKVLWSEPVDGKAAGKGERSESLTDQRPGAQAGYATSASIFSPHHLLRDPGVPAARLRIAVVCVKFSKGGHLGWVSRLDGTGFS